MPLVVFKFLFNLGKQTNKRTNIYFVTKYNFEKLLYFEMQSFIYLLSFEILNQ